jgi:hypothetical protein
VPCGAADFLVFRAGAAASRAGSGQLREVDDMAGREPVHPWAGSVRWCWRGSHRRQASSVSQRDLAQTSPELAPGIAQARGRAVRRCPRLPGRACLSARTIALQCAGFVFAVALVALGVAWLQGPGRPDEPKHDQPSILTTDNPGRLRGVKSVPDRAVSGDALLLAATGVGVVFVGGLLVLRALGRRRPVASSPIAEADATGDDLAAPLARGHVKPDVQLGADMPAGLPNQAGPSKVAATGQEGGGQLPEPFRQAGTTVTEAGGASGSLSCDQAASEVGTGHSAGGEQSCSTVGRIPRPSPSLGERIYERPARPKIIQEPDGSVGS